MTLATAASKTNPVAHSSFTPIQERQLKDASGDFRTMAEDFLRRARSAGHPFNPDLTPEQLLRFMLMGSARGSNGVSWSTMSLWNEPNIVLGTAQDLELYGNPHAAFAPHRLTVNVAWPDFFYIDDIKVGNVSHSLGATTDAYEFSDAWETVMSGRARIYPLPTVEPAQRITVAGKYTGRIPQGMKAGETFPLKFSFHGLIGI
jgi:hypothetical protein